MTHMLGAWEGGCIIELERSLERRAQGSVETGLDLGAPAKVMAWS